MQQDRLAPHLERVEELQRQQAVGAVPDAEAVRRLVSDQTVGQEALVVTAGTRAAAVVEALEGQSDSETGTAMPRGSH